jgi:cephalosporin-C deacetylase
MAYFDLPKDELERYRPEIREPKDFDGFWKDTLDRAKAARREPKFTKVDSRLTSQDVYDVEFSGFAGDPIRAWLLVPRGAGKKLPCVVEFVGYGGGRGLPHENLLYSSCGYAHFVMDTRGQGAGWRTGDTGDPEHDGSGSAHPGYMTRGIQAKESYYYRRLFADAAMAVDAAAAFPAVDPGRIAVAGGSQGGGTALATAGLLGDRLKAAMIDVPFLCHFDRALHITDSYPYQEIVIYLKCHRDQIDRTMQVLAYFDGISFASRARCPALFSVGLMDGTCPPSTVYAAYNRYAGPKDIKVWEFNNHEGGQAFQDVHKMEALAKAFNA